MEEIDLTLLKIREVMDNESGWNYLRAIMEHNLCKYEHGTTLIHSYIHHSHIIKYIFELKKSKLNLVTKQMIQLWSDIKSPSGTHSQLAAFLVDYYTQLTKENINIKENQVKAAALLTV